MVTNTNTNKQASLGIWGNFMHLEVHPASRFEARACTPLPKRKIQWGCCSDMSTLLVTSMWQTIFCAFANRVGSWIAVPEYNILVVICCNWLFVLVSSVLLLALATATAVAPRGHSYWMQAPLLHQLCRLISLRTSQLAGIVRFGTLSNICL